MMRFFFLLLTTTTTLVVAQIGLPIVDQPCASETVAASSCIATDLSCAVACVGSGITPQQQQVTPCETALQSYCGILECCPSCQADIQAAIDCSVADICTDGQDPTSCDSISVPPPPPTGTPAPASPTNTELPDGVVAESCVNAYFEYTGCLASNIACLTTCTDEVLVGETEFSEVDCTDETAMLDLCGNVVCCSECATQGTAYVNCEVEADEACPFTCNLGGSTPTTPTDATTTPAPVVVATTPAPVIVATTPAPVIVTTTPAPTMMEVSSSAPVSTPAPQVGDPTPMPLPTSGAVGCHFAYWMTSLLVLLVGKFLS